MRKILLFAALGSLGALIGAVVGEYGFRHTLAWARSYAPLEKKGSILTAPEPPPIASPVRQQRRLADVAPPEPPPPPRRFTKAAVPEPLLRLLWSSRDGCSVRTPRQATYKSRSFGIARPTSISNASIH